MTTGKTITLTRRTFVGKVMSLLFNMMSRLVITYLPRNKSFNFMTAVTISSDLGTQKNKIMASGPITSWQIDRETVEAVSDFTFLGSKITADG